WEQEFTQLKPVKRRGNRRYYQHHEVLLIRRIRELLYEQGFTISGARNRLDGPDETEIKADAVQSASQSDLSLSSSLSTNNKEFDFTSVKAELLEILSLLRPATVPV
ncbi:MAG: MerR family transcriptional regulator, partial [Pseudomonadota bacterium]